MRKILIFIIILNLFFTSASLNAKDSVKFSLFIENSETNIYNDYVISYNLITKNMQAIVLKYKNKCGLKENVALTNNKISYVLNDGNINEFYNALSKPVSNGSSEKYKNLDYHYAPLKEAVENICYYYEKARTYHNRNESAVVVMSEVEKIHNQFLQSYFVFREVYKDFSKELQRINDDQKYNDMVFLSEMTLDVHSEISKAVIIVSEIDSVVKRIRRYGYEVESEKTYYLNLENLVSQIEKLVSYDKKYLLDYGFTEDDILNLDLFTIRLQKIKLLSEKELSAYLLEKTNRKFSKEEFILEFRNYYNELISFYNKLSIINS